MMNKHPHKLVRITTIPASMQVLLRGQLRFMQSKGFEVHAVSADGKEVEALKIQEGVPHAVVPFTRVISPLQDLKCLIRLTRYLRKIKPQIVHTHTPKAGLIGMWAALLAGVPVRLHTIAGLPWMETSGAMRWLLKNIERITAWPATRVYPNSYKQLEYLRQNHIAGKKFKVLGNGSSNGIDTRVFSKNEEQRTLAQQLRINENVQPGAWVWIFIGRIVKDKGMEELLQAWKKIHAAYPEDRLWLLGLEERALDPLSETALAEMESNPSVKRWGFVQDVRPYLAASEVLVFPSYREGFPNVPMQAGAMECALILSDINGCNEIVEHNVSGMLVPPKNEPALYEAMKDIRLHPLKRDTLASAARKRIAEGFDQQQLWNKLLDEYSECLKMKNI